jgi:hypothetical protein
LHCGDSALWSPAAPLTSEDGSQWLIDKPTSASVHEATLIVGSPAVQWAAPTDSAKVWIPGPPLAGALLLPSGYARPVALPPNVTKWIAPIAIPAEDGGADVLWGAHADTGRFASFIVSSLWHARYDGERWSAPTKLVELDAIWWDSGVVQAILGRTAVHLATHAHDNTHGTAPWSGALYVRRSQGRWRVSYVHPPDFSPRYIAVIETAPRRVELIFSGALRYRDSVELNDIASMHSIDGGETWSAPIPIRRLSDRSGYWLRAERAASGLYHLFWASLALSPPYASNIAHLTTSDGERWSDAGLIALPWELRAYRVIASESLLIVVSQSTDATVHHVRWRRQAWMPPFELPWARSESLPTLVRTDHDIRLTFTTEITERSPNETAANTHRRWILLTSRLNPECS